jgi:hypothetical protein
MFRCAVLLVVGLFAWIYWPATQADFVIDDYVFITTSRMIDNPLPAFWQSHFYEPYYFRPLGILSWWVATRTLGLDYAAHSTINLAIHAVSVCLLACLLRDLGVRKWASLAGVALFALAPFSLAAALWPSNRFDLLAVLFLLCTTISMLRVLSAGSARWWLAMALAALAACWSKELAYPAATLLAGCALFYRDASVRQRLGVFALLGGVIGGAFLWRHRLIASPYAVLGSDPMSVFAQGARAWGEVLPQFAAFAVSESGAVLPLWIAGVAIVMALVLRARNRVRRFGDAPVLPGPSLGIVLGAFCVWLAISVPQTALAGRFSTTLDGAALGTITYGRFYYASAAAAAVIAAALLSRARFTMALSVVVIGCAIVVGLQQRSLAVEFARWTQAEIQPVAVAAAKIVDATAPVSTGSPPCVYVFLGTQDKHPWFRMFSDVTVKARTDVPAAAWQCYVMTESTPWIFAFPTHLALADVGLLPVKDVTGAKLDSTWGDIRYRYRLAPKDVRDLPSARFFNWNGEVFVDVTDEVRSGARVVKMRDWGQ